METDLKQWWRCRLSEFYSTKISTFKLKFSQIGRTFNLSFQNMMNNSIPGTLTPFSLECHTDATRAACRLNPWGDRRFLFTHDGLLHEPSHFERCAAMTSRDKAESPHPLPPPGAAPHELKGEPRGGRTIWNLPGYKMSRKSWLATKSCFKSLKGPKKWQKNNSKKEK